MISSLMNYVKGRVKEGNNLKMEKNMVIRAQEQKKKIGESNVNVHLTHVKVVWPYCWFLRPLHFVAYLRP